MLDAAARRCLWTARLISVALIVSCLLYVGVAGLALRGGSFPAREVPDAVLAGIVAWGLLAVVAAPFLERLLLARAVRVPGAWLAAGIVGNALRESAAVFGLVLTFMSGRSLPVLVGASVSVATLMLAFPREGRLEAFLRGD